MFSMQTILMPTDFSRCARQAFEHAVELASQTGATLHLLHVHAWMGQGADGPESFVTTLEDELAQAAASRTDEMEQHPVPPQVETVRVERRGLSVAEEILTYAGEIEADLVVMGTHGRRGLGQLFLGSVAEEVVRHARCPVFTVKERRHPRPLRELRRILVPVDFGPPSRRAIAKARRLAAGSGATVHLLHVVVQSVPPPFYAAGVESMLRVDPDIVPRGREEMQKLLRAAGGPEVPVEMHVREGERRP